jgi:malate dehydrogenase (oxaloacetate-decarboxylating)(NADP+)
MDRWKSPYAQATEARSLADVIGDADIFLGVSAPRVLKPEMVERMAARPLIMALANPEPENPPGGSPRSSAGCADLHRPIGFP